VEGEATVTPLRIRARHWPQIMEKAGWICVLLGFPLGNTTVGMVFLLLGSLGCLATGAGINWGLPANDSFYRWVYAFMGIMAVSAVFSSQPGIAFLVVLGFFLLFFLLVRGSHVLVGPSAYFNKDYVITGVIGAGIINSLYALYTYFVLGHPRAFGIDVLHNGLGTVSAFVAIIAIGYTFRSWGQGRYRPVVVGLMGVLLAVGALIVSFSRGAWLGFASSVLLFIIFLTRDVRGNRWLIAGLLILSLIGSALLITLSPKVQQRVLSIFSLDANDNRIIVWRTALAMIRANPVLGVGGGVFPLVYDEYRVCAQAGPPMSFAHNIVLQIAAEFGLAGLIAFSFMIGTVLARGWAIARDGGFMVQALYAGYVGMLTHQLVDNDLYSMDLGGLLWLATGLLLHLHHAYYGRHIPQYVRLDH